MHALRMVLIERNMTFAHQENKMTEQKKLPPGRLMQAKAFLDDGVITKEQFLEMTHGQSDLEEIEDSKLLLSIYDIVNSIEKRITRLESLMFELANTSPFKN